MGCAHSKDHPKNIDLVKLKKKYDAEPIKNAKLLHVWVVGADKENSLELGKLISEEGGFLYVTQDSLLQTEVNKGTERGEIIQEILQDKGTICPGIVLDLAIEKILKNLQGSKGVIFQGIPRDKEQAWHLQRIIGPVNLVIYVELPEEKLRTALSVEEDDQTSLKNKIEHFQKLITQLSKHKKIMKVDGATRAESLVEECLQKINSYVKSNTCTENESKEN